jgi:hypothetical protein
MGPPRRETRGLPWHASCQPVEPLTSPRECCAFRRGGEQEEWPGPWMLLAWFRGAAHLHEDVLMANLMETRR